MATLGQLPLTWRLFLRAYRWRRIDPVPWSPLRKPLREARVGIVTSAGFHAPGQEPFDSAVRGGDWSLRRIPANVELSSLREAHRSELFDHSGVEHDANLAFPIDRLREMEREGAIGSVSSEHVSVMGSITAPGQFVRSTAPEIARLFLEHKVDVALLVPV